MSEYFAENNRESTRDLFNKRLVYYSHTHRAGTNLVDFSYAEKRLYGRVNRMYVPIIANNYILELKGIRADISQLKWATALNCVVDAFTELSYQFKKKIMKNEIDPTSQYLANLNVHKAYVDPKRLYRTHLTTYVRTLGATIKNENIKFVNFTTFMKKIMPRIEATVREYPFTLPAFMKSTYCPINASGLAIEIADLDPSNDKVKWKEFYQSNNWGFYLNACANYGFMVDQHIPWRLVADIASGPMLRYAAPYEVRDTDTFLRAAYEPAHKNYFDIFKETFYQLYSANRQKRVTTAVVVNPDQTRLKIRRPNTYTRDALYTRYDDYYFLTLYCKIRFIEEESHFTQQEQEKIIDNIIELAQINFAEGLDIFELLLNKTFDYSGSLSYINNVRRQMAE